MRSLRSQIHIVQRTFGVVNAGFDNMEIPVGGSETCMPHKALQIKCIAAGFQYMRSKTMPQSVNCTGFCDSRFILVYSEHMFYPSILEASIVPPAGKQVMVWTGRLKNLPVPS